jgi:hypothetical protein
MLCQEDSFLTFSTCWVSHYEDVEDAHPCSIFFLLSTRLKQFRRLVPSVSKDDITPSRQEAASLQPINRAADDFISNLA